MEYDLAIAHRVSPGLAKTSVGFHDKLEMVKATTQSLLAALGGIRTKLYLIMDGCPPSYDCIIPPSSAGTVDIEVIRTNAIGNHATFALQIDILSKVENSEFVYFSEDDYLYDAHAFKAMMDAMPKLDIDFISPLDHPDFYLSNSSACPSRITYCEGLHWRTAPSTCLTFLTRPKTLRHTRDVFYLYSKGCLDSSMWIMLTGNLLHNPLQLAWHLLKSVINGPTGIPEIAAQFAVKHLRFHLLSLKRCGLYSPIPSLAVHLCNASLPPGASKFVSDGPMRTEMLNAETQYLSK